MPNLLFLCHICLDHPVSMALHCMIWILLGEVDCVLPDWLHMLIIWGVSRSGDWAMCAVMIMISICERVISLSFSSNVASWSFPDDPFRSLAHHATDLVLMLIWLVRWYHHEGQLPNCSIHEVGPSSNQRCSRLEGWKTSRKQMRKK